MIILTHMELAVHCHQPLQRNLAQGLSIEGSVKAAKEYLTGALKAGLNLGSGSGPLDHTYWLDINK